MAVRHTGWTCCQCISGPRMISHCGNVFGDVSGMISACFFLFVFRSHASKGYFGVSLS